MAIPIINPTIIQPINLDSFWLSKLQITAEDPNSTSTLIASMEKVQANADGTFTKAPDAFTAARGVLHIDNLEYIASTDPQTLTFKSPVTGQDITMYTAEIMLAVTLKIKQMAEARSII